MNESERAVMSIAMSESRKSNARLSDGFMGFALKSLLIVKDASATSRLKVLNQLGVRFNGSPVSKAMLTGILIFDDKMTPTSKQTLRKIEEKFGKEPLTSGYAKLNRISGICSYNAAARSETAADLMGYVLEFLWWALLYEVIVPGNVTAEYLDKPKDGALGVVHIALGRNTSTTSSLLGWKTSRPCPQRRAWPLSSIKSCGTSARTRATRMHSLAASQGLPALAQLL
jgi:hypothetical protein